MNAAAAHVSDVLRWATWAPAVVVFLAGMCAAVLVITGRWRRYPAIGRVTDRLRQSPFGSQWRK